MDFIKLTHERLDVAAINDLVVHESCGAVSMFIGTTRDNFENKKVISLEYEAYESMATKVMKTICDGIRVTWPDIKNIAMYHRLGVVPVKDASVVIAITSPHRESSLKAVAHAINELKKSVPIFKKEIYDGSNSEWKQNKESGLKMSKFSKRSKLDFNSCRVDTTIVPKILIQINADENEVSRRIQCFVEKKREEINLNNTLDFIAKGKDVEEEEQSCARVNSIAIKQKDCKGIVRIHRVKNESGPQIKPNYTITLDKLTKNEISDVKIKDEPCDSIKDQSNLPVQEQRIQAIEKFFKITPNSKDINDRLKTIEDKILFLETVSPEYHHFIGHKKTNVVPKVKKQVYSLEDLDKLIQNVKSTNATLINS